MADILLVEDEAPVREALAMALEDEGFRLAQAVTAEQGLEILSREEIPLLVTDFNLPGERGDWLIQQARAKGCYTRPALMVTAAVRVPKLENVEILHKPLDLDVFIGRVRTLIGATEAAPPQRPPPLDLVLYVGRNAASMRAERSVEQQLRLVPATACGLRIVRLGDKGGDDEAERDHVTFAPTLVMRGPLTRTWAVGDAAINRNLEMWLEAATEGARRLAMAASANR